MHERAIQDDGAMVNIGLAERVTSVALGGALTWTGLRRISVGGALMALAGGALAYRGITGHCKVCKAMGVEADDVSPTSHPFNRRIHGHAAVTVNRPIHEVYAYWRSMANVQQFMPRIQSKGGRDGAWRWLARGPGEHVLRFDTRIVKERVDELIAWRTVEGADIEHGGQVLFCDAPPGRGTEVYLHYWYMPPMGVVGDAIGKLAGFNCRMMTHQGLRQMKQLLETGEVATAGPPHRDEQMQTIVEAQAHGPAEQAPMDIVEESSMESFPASDAPSFTTRRAS